MAVWLWLVPHSFCSRTTAAQTSSQRNKELSSVTRGTNSPAAVVVYKVLVLLVEELGGSSGFLERFSGETFKISTGPCCCCCPCLPRVPMSRYTLPLSFELIRSLFLYFYTDSMVFWLFLCTAILQIPVIPAEVRCSAVCHPKNITLYSFNNTLDKRQLWCRWCKCLKCSRPYLIVRKIKRA